MKTQGLKQWIVLAMVFSGFLLLAAGDQGATAQATESKVYLPFMRQALEPIIPETTVVLSADTTQYLESISADGSVYTFSQMTNELAGLDPDDVMVTGVSVKTPEGFLRKVSAIDSNGGQLVVTTTQGTLEDAIQQGELHLSQALTPDMVSGGSALQGVHLLRSTQQAFYFQLINVPLYDGDGNPNTWSDRVVANGEITLETGINFDFAIGFFSLEWLNFTTWVTETADLEITAYAAGASIDEEQPLATYYLTPITIPVGAAPVVIVPELSLVVGLDGEVHVGVTTGVTQSLAASAGVGYTDGDWGIHHSLNNSFEWEPPAISAGMQAKGYLGPQITAELYGVAGPYARAQAYLLLEVDPLATITWELYGGFEMPVGVEVEVMGQELVDFGAVALDESWLLASAPPPPPGAMVLIPAGSFMKGCESNVEEESCVPADANAVPSSTGAYWIDVFEVTNAQYAQCVAAGMCTPPRINSSQTRTSYYDNPNFADYPVIWVDRTKASEYCAWAGKRLPTSDEWEKAARGGGSDTRMFPWGDNYLWETRCSDANLLVVPAIYQGYYCVGDTTPVGSYPSGASPYGLLDMSGNVEEWTSTQSGTYAIVRGSSWGGLAGPARTHFESTTLPSTDSQFKGFRCAADGN